MIRRQLISDELRYSHQTSPRKTRTVRGSGVFQPSILYQSTVVKFSPNDWVGRKLIQWDGENIMPYIRSVQLFKNDPDSVSEFEIANFAKSGSYRVLYVIKIGNKLFLKSKPSIDTVPSRLNVLVTPDNIIQKIMYF